MVTAYKHLAWKERENWEGPSAVHVVDKYVYVSDHVCNCLVVYETSGQFVTSFGRHGHDLEEGEFDSPYCVTSCADGFMCVII